VKRKVTRRSLVRLAGRWAQMSPYMRAKAIEAEAGLAAFSQMLRVYSWGARPEPVRVSVPRSLRHVFGRWLDT
jgi:hypothetical protein